MSWLVLAGALAYVVAAPAAGFLTGRAWQRATDHIAWDRREAERHAKTTGTAGDAELSPGIRAVELDDAGGRAGSPLPGLPVTWPASSRIGESRADFEARMTLERDRPPGSWNYTLPIRDRHDPRYHTPENQRLLRETRNDRASKPDE